HFAIELVLTRRSHLAEDENPLAAVVLDRNGDLRISQEVGRELLLQLLLEPAQRQTTGLHTSQLWICERSVLLDREFAGQLRLPKHADREDILRTNLIVGLCASF